MGTPTDKGGGDGGCALRSAPGHQSPQQDRSFEAEQTWTIIIIAGTAVAASRPALKVSKTHSCACSAVPVVQGESAHQLERSGLRMVRRHHKRSVCSLAVQRGSAIRAQGGDETETRARASTLGGKGRPARGVPGVEATRVAALTSEIRSVSPSVASEPPRAREKSEPAYPAPPPCEALILMVSPPFFFEMRSLSSIFFFGMRPYRVASPNPPPLFLINQ